MESQEQNPNQEQRETMIVSALQLLLVLARKIYKIFRK